MITQTFLPCLIANLRPSAELAAPLGHEARKLIAIRVDPQVLQWLKNVAIKRHVPYQSLINDILAREMKKAG